MMRIRGEALFVWGPLRGSSERHPIPQQTAWLQQTMATINIRSATLFLSPWSLILFLSLSLSLLFLSFSAFWCRFSVVTRDYVMSRTTNHRNEQQPPTDEHTRL
ncbi:hypothetical protein CIHG_07919 [Coccidioides immitis H538.4]|uniref:Uncharacterized protein n=1 Tax=Coccidioides immitis H538.4 TaxID=396776 RepID=A0A0J8S174_COCIT|nr:hypothetical protein CIHG_07919 [Coccidioides immitis H538.4]